MKAFDVFKFDCQSKMNCVHLCEKRKFLDASSVYSFPTEKRQTNPDITNSVGFPLTNAEFG
jgi:hypothetical protein